jgi:GNAT superfamily N-acetyltransferase
VPAAIRLCAGSDISAVRDLLVRTWHNTYDGIYGADRVTEITDKWHSVQNLSRQVRQPLSAFLVAEDGGRIVGTSKATIDERGALTLARLYIDPSAQRSGIGSALLDATIAAFPFATHVDLDVEPKNVKAVAFYGRHGFLPLGPTAERGDGSGIPARTMRKPLNQGGGTRHPGIMLRSIRDSDAQDLIGLIALCFAEYPGCYFDPHGDMPDIVRPAQSRLAAEGHFLAIEDPTGRVCACIGIDFPEPGTAELHRLYVRADMRGRGLGSLLTGRMEALARERGVARMILWSDTRFITAHALYERVGYARGHSRSLGDISQSREFFFHKALAAHESAA